MSLIASSDGFVKSLCDALGIDYDYATKIVITIEAGKIATVEASGFINKQGLDDISELITQKYHLAAVDVQDGE